LIVVVDAFIDDVDTFIDIVDVFIDNVDTFIDVVDAWIDIVDAVIDVVDAGIDAVDASIVAVDEFVAAVDASRAALEDASRPRQLDHRDLPAHGQTRRRAPVAGAAVDVEPRPADAMEAGHDGLELLDHQVEREELSAVGVAGELEVDAKAAGGVRSLRPVGEQHFHG
jgi:hypothetical protein